MKITIEEGDTTITYTRDVVDTTELVWSLYYTAVATGHFPANLAAGMVDVGEELLEAFGVKDED